MSEELTIEQILEEEDDRYLPLVHYALKRSNPDLAFPDNGRVIKLRQMIAVRNIFIFEELKRALQAFDEAGIEAILLKGAAMEGIYPAGLRPFSDIDILIRKEKLLQAMETISALGYRLQPLRSGLRTDDFYTHGEVQYIKDGVITVRIEFHWTLGPPYPYSGRVDIEGVWKRASRSKIAGVDALVLSPEDSLLHSCLHLFRHYHGGWLASSCDIAELIHHYEDRLDWEAFLDRVFQYRVCLPVQYSLKKTSELFKPPIPGFVLEKLGKYKPSGFERRVFALLANPRDENSSKEALARFLTMPTALRFRYLWFTLFPSREFMLIRYYITKPERLPLYYLLRLKDAVVLAFKAVFNFTFVRRDS